MAEEDIFTFLANNVDANFDFTKRNFFKKISTLFDPLGLWAPFFFFFKLGFTPCKAKQPLRGMELQEKKHKKDYMIQKVCLDRTYS